jgi:DNA replication protein DnaC
MTSPTQPHDTDPLDQHLHHLKLPWVRDHREALAARAAKGQWTHLEFLARLLEGESHQRRERATRRRIAAARFPVVKTLETFDWSWPEKINRLEVQDLFRLRFIQQRRNVLFLGGCGLGKSHLAAALGHQACLEGHRVLFISTAELLNQLLAARTEHRLKTEIKKVLRPDLLILDELGYIPIDKHGADLLFQVVSQRYERGSIILTSNKAYKDWPAIFNNDNTVTSAILDRLLHHAQTIPITGSSYRMGRKAEA